MPFRHPLVPAAARSPAKRPTVAWFNPPPQKPQHVSTCQTDADCAPGQACNGGRCGGAYPGFSGAGYDHVDLLGIDQAGPGSLALPAIGTGAVVGAAVGLVARSPRAGLITGAVTAGIAYAGLWLVALLFKAS